MLKNIPCIISPELLKLLCEMGHTDELVIADGNFPCNAYNDVVIRADGHGVPTILSAILELFPLDTYSTWNVRFMGVVKGDPVVPIIWDTYKAILNEKCEEKVIIEEIDKWDFYAQTKSARLVIATSESALYGNIILKKGVIKA